MTSYSRSDYLSRVGNLTDRMTAVADADEARREAQANVAGMEAQVDDTAAMLPIDKDDNAMGISLGAAEGYKYLLKNQVGPRVAEAIKSRAAAKLESMLDDVRSRPALERMGYTEADAAQLFDSPPTALAPPAQAAAATAPGGGAD